jgi:hypothetical protein
MDNMKFKLTALWTATMLSYLWADILRLYSGEYTPGADFMGVQPTPGIWLGSAVLMSIPIVMIVLSATLNYRANRWTNIVFGAIFFLINVAAWAIPPFAEMFDLFIAIIGLVFNVMTVRYAWKWKNDGA